MASKFNLRIFWKECNKAGIFHFGYLRSRRFSFATVRNKCTGISQDDNPISFATSHDCDIHDLGKVQNLVHDNLVVYDEFITPEEEDMLYQELRPSLEKQSYQHEHWDDAIHGYREVEKATWSRECMLIFKRVKDTAFSPEHSLLPYVHVLDLDSNGFIKPHIDSIKFCGSTIAGLSLLSPSVMRFRHESFKDVVIDAKLARRSLYITRNAVRYQFTHEILPPDLSLWKENVVQRTRRISLMLRCEPEPDGG